MITAKVRSELQFAECLEGSGPGGQILRNVSRIVAPGGASSRGVPAELSGWVGPLKKNTHACGVGVGWERG